MEVGAEPESALFFLIPHQSPRSLVILCMNLKTTGLMMIWRLPLASVQSVPVFSGEQGLEYQKATIGEKHLTAKGKFVFDPSGWLLCCCAVSSLCPTLCDPMDYSTPGLSVPYRLLKFAQVHAHCIGDVTSHFILKAGVVIRKPKKV